MSKIKIEMPHREGMPHSCIVCSGSLHRKSEHYCSQKCADGLALEEGGTKWPFLSKWKCRKVKGLKDPTIAVRTKTRRKTNDLLKRGKIKKKPCVVCKSQEVLAHHEDYNNPWKIIWICEKHHKEYHDGKISLYNGTLTWNPDRLTKLNGLLNIPQKKYRIVKEVFEKKLKDSSERELVDSGTPQKERT